ncbi:MAG: hypothetical protein RL417_552 [Pseudomonadota bacterium]|jgi:4-amino-4-deoxy-L-arabinose transferase-like glycosyltransferase
MFAKLYPLTVSRALLATLLVFFVLTVPWLGSTPFSTRGEPREALVAQAMVSTGEWVLPRGYSDDVPSKPPFMHWIIAGVSLIRGGVTEFTARVPSAGAALVFLGAFFLFIARRFSVQRAVLTCLVLMFGIEWFRTSIICRVDMTLTALLAGALVALFRWSEQDLRGFPVTAALLLVGATLTKGPVSIVLPGAILGLFLLIEGRSFGRVLQKALLLGIPVIAAASLWYLLAWNRGGDDFVAKVLYENVDRFSGTMEDKPHAHSAFYLYLTVLIGFLPWTLFIGPSLVNALICRIRSGGLSLRALGEKFRALSPFERYAILVIGAFLVFFSIPTSKRSVYLLPAYPFIAFFLARFVEEGLAPVVWRRAARVTGVFIVALFGVVAAYHAGLFDLGLFIKKPNTLFDATYFATQLGAVGAEPLGVVILGGVVLLGIVALIRPWRGREFTLLVALLSGVYLAANGVIVPALQRPLSLQRYASDLAPQITAAQKIYSFGTEFYGVSFYLNREIYRAAPGIEDGARVVVLDRHIKDLEVMLGAGRGVKTLSVSPYGVVKPRDRVALVEVIPQGQPLSEGSSVSK